MDNRPQGRKKNIVGQSHGLNRRGEGLGTGLVGGSGGIPTAGNSSNGRNAGGMPNGNFGRRPVTRSGGGGGMLRTLILLGALLLGGGAGVTGMMGQEPAQSVPQTPPAQTAPAQVSGYTNPFGAFSGSFGTQSSSHGWLDGNNTGVLNTRVAPEARGKYTQLLGNGDDTVTIMLYMCGTDLESRSAMASKDLQEMVNATLSDKVNLIVFTGGCRQWRNSIVSSSVNQIYQVKNGGVACLSKDAGNGVMTDPKTLTSFIQFCTKNFPANRNMLILWDHGGGSLSGYGYDEKSPNAGAMNLSAIRKALEGGKTKFDAIGFDACLMATLETGLTLSPYADYLIASEETEPGLGWYYTDWLNALSRNPSLPTLELGKRIADDFVSACARSCPGQKTTLSVVDLAELEATVPEDFKAFSAGTLALLKDNGYTKVSDARAGTREFSVSSKIDQVDLVHLALNLGTQEGRTLADTIREAVKYNKTSSDMTNAYGLSLYFPYQKTGKVNTAVQTYSSIGLDETYSDCIRTFATMEVSGQAAANTSPTPLPTLMGSPMTGGSVSSDMLTQMLTQLLTGSGYGNIAGADFFDRSLDIEAAASFLAENRLDAENLVWKNKDTYDIISMPESQWKLVQNLDLNVFVDDGQGFMDLGLDNVFDFDEDGDLMGVYDNTWLSIDGQTVAYYHTDTTQTEEGTTITGRIPVLLNGNHADLILVFSDEHPDGYIAGARFDYRGEGNGTVAKGMTELEKGDVIDFLCDYYTYDGDFMDVYYLGETHYYTGNEVIGNSFLEIPGTATYRFRDIYNNIYWTAPVALG